MTLAEWVAVGVAAVTLAAALAAWARRRRARLVERIARAVLDELVERQSAEDRAALYALPPGVTAEDALDLASRLGIGVEEAARMVFLTRARIVVAENLRRHHGRRPSGGT